MSEHIYKSHNKSLLLYHLVFPVKYRRKAISQEVSETIKQICLGISERYDMHFVEIGLDEDHAHFLIQTAPMLSPSETARIVKSITARLILKHHPRIQEMLWGGNFGTSGYYANTVGLHGNEAVIRDYVQSQGKNYEQVYRTNQLKLF